MATITPKITGQRLDDSWTYAYLYESLYGEVLTHPTSSEYEMKVDLEVYDPLNGTTLLEKIVDYALFDQDSEGKTEIDYMALIRQHTQTQWYKIGHIDDIDWTSVISRYIYNCQTRYYVSSGEAVKTIPIIGGRGFRDFIPAVGGLQSLTEWEVLGVPQPEFLGYPKISQSLQPGSQGDYRPTVTKVISTTGQDICGGYLIWKSKYGGWCTYGFNLRSDSKTGSYISQLSVDSFLPTESGGYYMPTDYTGIRSKNTTTLRSIGVSIDHAKAISGLAESPAIYLYDKDAEKMELVRLSALSVPIDNLKSGTNVEVVLSAIDVNEQLVR